MSIYSGNTAGIMYGDRLREDRARERALIDQEIAARRQKAYDNQAAMVLHDGGCGCDGNTARQDTFCVHGQQHDAMRGYALKVSRNQ